MSVRVPLGRTSGAPGVPPASAVTLSATPSTSLSLASTDPVAGALAVLPRLFTSFTATGASFTGSRLTVVVPASEVCLPLAAASELTSRTVQDTVREPPPGLSEPESKPIVRSAAW